MELLVFLAVQDPSGVRSEMLGDSFWEADDDYTRGVISFELPKHPSLFNFSMDVLIVEYAGASAANGNIMILKPISFASLAEMDGVAPCSTIFSKHGMGARSLTAFLAWSRDVMPSRNATSAPAA